MLLCLRDGSAYTVLLPCTGLESRQHVIVSQGRICSDNCTSCHTEIEVKDQTFCLAQPVPALNITPGAWQGSHWSVAFSVTGMTRPRKIPKQAGIKALICRSRSGSLNHKANEVLHQASQSLLFPPLLVVVAAAAVVVFVVVVLIAVLVFDLVFHIVILITIAMIIITIVVVVIIIISVVILVTINGSESRTSSLSSAAAASPSSSSPSASSSSSSLSAAEASSL